MRRSLTSDAGRPADTTRPAEDQVNTSLLTAQDQTHLRRTLELAERGRGRTSPNPVVGAVVVSAEGEVIGEGYHHVHGGPHAERVAIESCSMDTTGGTIYVSLEPCAHTGKQPPCTRRMRSCWTPAWPVRWAGARG